QPPVPALHSRPDQAVAPARSQHRSNAALDLVDGTPIEVEALRGVRRCALPVLELEAALGPPGDGGERLLPAFEGLEDRRRRHVRHAARGEGGAAVAGHALSLSEAQALAEGRPDRLSGRSRSPASPGAPPTPRPGRGVELSGCA